jgi:hypothetical protein
MGSGSSKPSLQKGDTYAITADSSRKLADEILKIFFTRADFKDLLSLASLSSCSTYVFTTADALNTLFQTLKVYPSLGKKGEILFAPVRRLSPGLLPIKEMDQGTAAEIENRNKVCMDVAYFYVRIFQIYAALALTVLDSDPTRKRSGFVIPKQQQQKAVFFGGALRDIKKEMLNTSFEPLLQFKPKTSQTSNNFYIQFELSSNNIIFSILWNYNNEKGLQEMIMPCYLGGRTNTIELEIRMTPVQNQEGISIIMSINNEQLFEFIKRIADPTWRFRTLYPNESQITNDSNVFINTLNLFFQIMHKQKINIYEMDK